MAPVHVFIGGFRLEHYTSLRLRRAKKDLTGSVTITIFAGAIPALPLVRAVKAGAPILIYVGGHLAFKGTVDERDGSGKKGKSGGTSGRARRANGQFAPGSQTPGATTRIGPNEYTITITARGTTKRMADASHDYFANTTVGAKTKPVIERIARPFRVPLDWRAPVLDMDKSVLRDGSTAVSEVFRICNEHGYYAYETRDGRLRVTDEAGPETGEPIILGENILEFDTAQREDVQNSQITVKGQRTKKDIRGKAAVNRSRTIKNDQVSDYAPIVLQHYGDASDEALDRRARFEASNRESDGKKVNVTVFHVQSRTGQPWDIGMLHYTEVPCDGIFEVMECIELEYEVDAANKLQTRLTLAPPPASPSGPGLGLGPGAGPAGLGGLAALAGQVSAQARAIASIDISASRMAALGFSYAAGQYPAPWGAASLIDVAADALGAPPPSALSTMLADAFAAAPLTLPEHLLGGGS